MLWLFPLEGVQILLREYDFESKKHPTFTEDDIMNLFPIVKHTNPKVSRHHCQILTGVSPVSSFLNLLLCLIYKIMQSDFSDNKIIYMLQAYDASAIFEAAQGRLQGGQIKYYYIQLVGWPVGQSVSYRHDQSVNRE